MSRKHRRQVGRGKLVWPIMIGGGVLLLVAAWLFDSRGSGGSGGGSDSGTPQIAVDQQKIDYGYVKFGETRVFKIAVTNTGDGALRFKQKPYIEVLEGC